MNNYNIAKQEIVKTIDRYRIRHVEYKTAIKVIHGMTTAFAVAKFITADEADRLYNETLEFAEEELD